MPTPYRDRLVLESTLLCRNQWPMNISPTHHPSTYSPHHLPFPPRSLFLLNLSLPLLPKLVPILLASKVIFTPLPPSLSIIASFSSLTVQLLHIHFPSPITLTFHSCLSSFPLVNGTCPSSYSTSSFLLPKRHPAPGSIQCLFYCCSIKYFLIFLFLLKKKKEMLQKNKLYSFLKVPVPIKPPHSAEFFTAHHKASCSPIIVD